MSTEDDEPFSPVAAVLLAIDGGVLTGWIVEPLPAPLCVRLAALGAALAVQLCLLLRFVERGPDY
jgi:hypothetical protein